MPTTQPWLASLYDLMLRWAPCGMENLPSGCRLIGHIPHIAPYAYLHKLPPSLSSLELDDLENALGMGLSSELRDLYAFSNGMDLFSEISLFGKRYNHRRSDLLQMLCQPFDILSSNFERRYPYLEKGKIIIGYYQYDGSYIVTDGDHIFRRDRSTGEVFNFWNGLEVFLSEEAARMAANYDDTGKVLDENLILPTPAA